MNPAMKKKSFIAVIHRHKVLVWLTKKFKNDARVHIAGIKISYRSYGREVNNVSGTLSVVTGKPSPISVST